MMRDEFFGFGRKGLIIGAGKGLLLVLADRRLLLLLPAPGPAETLKGSAGWLAAAPPVMDLNRASVP